VWAGDPWAAAALEGDCAAAAEEDAFFERVWSSLGRGGDGNSEDLAQVGDLQHVRYRRPAWGKLVVAYRAATRRAKRQDSNDRRGSRGRVSTPRGRHHAAALGYDGGLDCSVGGLTPPGGVGSVGFDDY
jgi:hypothetical protein